MTKRQPSTFVISITPFDDQERLDEAGLRGHLRRLAEAGIGVYVGGGGSGEGYTLDAAEAQRVLQIAVEELKGKVPVRAMGVEPRTAKQMVEFSRLVADAGLDAMQIYSLDMGHSAKPRPDELEQYFTDILSAVRLPAVLSTHTSVGYLLPIELIAKLVAQYDNIIGINCSTVDHTYVVRLLDALNERIDVHVGGPMLALDALAFGASGFLSSEGNLAPRLCVSIIEKYRSGDLAGAHEAYATLMRLFDMTKRHNGIQATKAALQMLGLPGGIPRRPRRPITDQATLDEIRALVEQLDIAGIERLEARIPVA
jgi:4-hydroxy-tetrahydrodipicolinate synthase